MGLTEREKEIALECIAKVDSKGWDFGVHKELVQFAALLLSRIREEQEAVAWIYKVGKFEQVSKTPPILHSKELSENGIEVTRLFTTPQECKDLEVIKQMMVTGTTDSFMSLSNEQKRMAFSVGIRESTLRKQLNEECSELAEALKGLLILIDGNDKTMGMLDVVDGYYQFGSFSKPFRDKANEALANHAKRMKGEE